MTNKIFCSKRTRITKERLITTTNDSDRPFKVKVHRTSPFLVKKSPEKEKFKRRIILCEDDLDEKTSNSSISSESDDLNSSFLEYEELKTESTYSFKQKHIIEDEKARKMILNVGSKTVLKNQKKNSVKVISHSSFYRALYQGCSKEAQSRLDSMMKINESYEN